MTSNNGTCFTDLSAELRNKIYELSGCLVLRGCQGRYCVGSCCCIMFSANGHRPRPIQPALTKVSKQVRAETLPIFYGTMKVRVMVGGYVRKDGAKFREWLYAIGRKNAGLIRDIMLYSGGPFAFFDRTCSQKSEREADTDYCRFVLHLRQVGVKEEAMMGNMRHTVRKPAKFGSAKSRSFEEMMAAGKAAGMHAVEFEV